MTTETARKTLRAGDQRLSNEEILARFRREQEIKAEMKARRERDARIQSEMKSGMAGALKKALDQKKLPNVIREKGKFVSVKKILEKA